MKTRKTKSTILSMLLLTMAMLCVMSCNKPDDPNNGGNEGGDTPEPGEVIDGPDLMTFTVNGVSFDMIKVEGGTFWMGAQSENENGQNYDNEANDAESPVHQVALSDYYIGKYEVTQELWLAVMGTNPSHFQGDLLPVENVGPNSIKDFLSTLNERLSQETNGLQFRLPSEAQWEFAAKGGKESYGDKYSGSNVLSIVAWYNQNANEQTHPVGAKEPNELFIYDMSGNVAEWCQDYMGGYVGIPQTDPIGPSHEFITGVIGDIKGCIVRGGAWSTSAQYCRSSSRAGWLAGDSSIGFRLVLSRTEGQISVPGVRTGEISNITTNSACVRGSIVSDGGMYPTEWGFYYGTSQDLTVNGICITVSEYSNPYSFNDTLTNLQLGTKYYVCAYAKNEIGISFGDMVSFTTLADVITSEVTDIGRNNARCGGTVYGNDGDNVVERGVCWGKQTNPTINNNVHTASGSGIGGFTCDMSGLTAGTIYYVRAYAINGRGVISYGNEQSFRTLDPEVPTVKTESAYCWYSNGDSFMWEATGVITDDGGATVNYSKVGFLVSTSPNPTFNDNNSYEIESWEWEGGIQGINRKFTKTWGGLFEHTTYYFRAYATNTVGIGYGEVIEKTTGGYPSATIVTNSVTNITSNSAVCGGVVTTNGYVDAKGLYYGTNPNNLQGYLDTSGGAGSYTLTMRNLQPNTTYYVKAWACGMIEGTCVYGEVQVFTTLP